MGADRMVEFIKYLQEGVTALGLSLPPGEMAQYRRYFELLLAWNDKFNLTAVTEPLDAAIKHFADSLSLTKVVDGVGMKAMPEVMPTLPGDADGEIFPGSGLKVCDIGTGAGFPGLVCKIHWPGWQVTLVEAQRKKVTFLQAVADELGLKQGIEFIHGRAEDLGRGALREGFDLVVARGVARLPVLAELCLPLVRVGGYFVAMKAVEAEQEVQEAATALVVLGGRVSRVEKFNLPLLGDGRSLVVIAKDASTPARYPRRAGMAQKHPLA